MESKIYNQEGKEVGKISLPESVFSLPYNSSLVHQVVVSMQSNARTPVAHAKDRSDVRGGGKKPWRQKGTGRARHGSTRSPIWVGGGVTHGPSNEKNYKKKINKKMRAKALYSVLAQKFRDGEVIFVDDLLFDEPKTAQAKSVLSSLGAISGFEGVATKKRNAAYIAVDKKNESVAKSFNNFGNIEVDEVRNINPVDLLNYKYVIITKPEESLKVIESRLK